MAEGTAAARQIADASPIVSTGRRGRPMRAAQQVEVWGSSNASALLRADAVGHGAPVDTGELLPTPWPFRKAAAIFFAASCHGKPVAIVVVAQAARSYFSGNPKGKCCLMSSPIDTFAERLLLYRNRKKLTQEDVAEHLGCAQSSVSDWEKKRAKSSPTVSQIHLLAKLLDVTADHLVGLSDSPSGLPPDAFLVDLDAYETLPPGKEWSVKIPRRAKLVDFEEWRKMDSDVRARAKGRGNRRED